MEESVICIISIISLVVTLIWGLYYGEKLREKEERNAISYFDKLQHLKNAYNIHAKKESPNQEHLEYILLRIRQLENFK